jgi:hypothetical protein
MAIQMQAMTQLNGCGSATLSGSTLTVSFGGATGCTLKNGTTVSGSMTLAVTQMSGSVTVAETFNALTVNGTDLSGTASFSTTNGTRFTVDAMLTSKGNSVSAALTVNGTGTDITIDGMVNTTRSGAMTTAMFNALDWGKGDCYPKSGTVGLTKGPISETVTFTAATATSGVVQVSVGRLMTTKTLPAYGSCPKG